MPPQSAAYDRTLSRHVKNGRVNYQEIGRDPDFASYLSWLAEAPANSSDTGPAALAYWLNAYNAIVIQAVGRHYPLDSVRPVPGFFNRERHRVGGRQLTIDDLERLARSCGDYRAHFALTCASAGAPPLRSEAYDAGRLDAQLDDQGRRFFADRQHGVRFDPGRGVIWASRIFKWSSPDLIGSRLPEFLVAPFIKSQIIEMLKGYLDSDGKALLARQSWRLRFMAYDWALNA